MILESQWENTEAGGERESLILNTERHRGYRESEVERKEIGGEQFSGMQLWERCGTGCGRPRGLINTC